MYRENAFVLPVVTRWSRFITWFLRFVGFTNHSEFNVPELRELPVLPEPLSAEEAREISTKASTTEVSRIVSVIGVKIRKAASRGICCVSVTEELASENSIRWDVETRLKNMGYQYDHNNDIVSWRLQMITAQEARNIAGKTENTRKFIEELDSAIEEAASRGKTLVWVEKTEDYLFHLAKRSLEERGFIITVIGHGLGIIHEFEIQWGLD